jgi:hypothetical protein
VTQGTSPANPKPREIKDFVGRNRNAFDKVKLIFVSLHLHTADSRRGKSNFAIYVLKLMSLSVLVTSLDELPEYASSLGLDWLITNGHHHGESTFSTTGP